MSVFTCPVCLYIANVCYLLRRYSQIDRTTKNLGTEIGGTPAAERQNSEQSLITDGGLIFFRSTFASPDVCFQFAEWDDRRSAKNPVPGCIESNYSSQGGGYREDRVNMIEACYNCFSRLAMKKLPTIASRRGAKCKFLLAEKNTRQNFPLSVKYLQVHVAVEIFWVSSNWC